ncbi:MAG: Holliday junction resolvase RuvX [Acidaminococcaceae bacterium]|nr:Holliday junction resolvase RuvX [Acidaminococcaceae bacterium]
MKAEDFRVLGLDLGERTIGVALSDPGRILAGGVETIRRSSLEKDLQRLAEIVTANMVKTIVLGYPKNMNGSIGPRALLVQSFADTLAVTFPDLNIVFWDERLSTVAAEKVLVAADMRRAKRKKVIDKMAAVVILQNFLDSRKKIQ